MSTKRCVSVKHHFNMEPILNGNSKLLRQFCGEMKFARCARFSRVATRRSRAIRHQVGGATDLMDLTVAFEVDVVV